MLQICFIISRMFSGSPPIATNVVIILLEAIPQEQVHRRNADGGHG